MNRPSSALPVASGDRKGLCSGREPGLRQADELGARALGARLDLEGHLLAAVQAVEVLDAVAVEEVLLAVLGCDEAESAVGNELLDGSCSHLGDSLLERKEQAMACSRKRL